LYLRVKRQHLGIVRQYRVVEHLSPALLYLVDAFAGLDAAF
jgi:hypothetical protein